MKRYNGWYRISDKLDLRDLSNLEWTVETFGPSDVCGRWFYSDTGTGFFYFKKRNDALLYTLRWPS